MSTNPLSTTSTPATRLATSERASGASSRVVALSRWIAAERVDIAIVTCITLVAAVLRFWHLGTVPLGLHGDEAWTGIDARRILDEGWIGVYVQSALGQPTGPLYFTALLFKFFPDTTTTLRVSMAIFGVATIPLAYLAFATMFNRTAAAIGASLLALMMWHLHLSRTGFMVIAWPFAEMLVLWLLFLAMRRRSVWLFVAAGAAHGLGFYTYNVYTAFAFVPFVALIWMFFAEPGRARKVQVLRFAAVFAFVTLLVAMPLIRYVTDNLDQYREHQQVVGLTDSVEWKRADASDRLHILWDRGREWERGLIYGNRPDLGDGLATQDHPVVSPVVLLLACGGIGMALSRVNKPEYAILIAGVLFLPSGALLTIGDGLFRRTLGLAPFVAILAALPLAWLWQRASKLQPRARYAIFAAVLLVPIYTGARTTYQYFGPVQDTEDVKYVYPYQFDAASRYMNDLPHGTYVYLYSDRWSFDYETRRFLAPNAKGEDRSFEFRELPAGGSAAPLNPVIGRAKPVVFVFLGPYLDGIDEVMKRYPGGAVTESTRDGETLFRAYAVQ